MVGDFYLFSRLKSLGGTHLSVPLVEANTLNLSIRETLINISKEKMKHFFVKNYLFKTRIFVFGNFYTF